MQSRRLRDCHHAVGGTDCATTLGITDGKGLPRPDVLAMTFFLSLRARIFAGETIPQTAGQFAVWDSTIQCFKWYKILS